MVYDVVVCGGGIAGVSAALAASRNGASVLLLEREYALGGLATLGLICVYLPLCDGAGVQMSGGIAEELLKCSAKYGPGEVPAAWKDANGSTDARAKERYQLTFNPASCMISMEEALLEQNVKILYGAQISGVKCKDERVKQVVVETKTGPQLYSGRTFVDATGDADICYFAGEETVEWNINSKTGWYFSYDPDKKDLQLHGLTEPYALRPEDVKPERRVYSGIDIEDISQQCIDGRAMILEDVLKRRETDPNIYARIIPSFHGLRMTRRLQRDGAFSTEDEGCYCADAIGMIGNWKKREERYALSVKIIEAGKNGNLYVAGRCVAADNSGQDLTRVIPTCAVTGEAAGTMAAFQARHERKPSIEELQEILRGNGVLLDPSLFVHKTK